jgi:hypothetical protein
LYECGAQDLVRVYDYLWKTTPRVA